MGWVPAAYYLRTSVAGIDSCKLSPCSCSPLFTYICCRHRFLQTQPMFLQPIIYVHLSQAAIPANSAHVPAAHYLRTSGAGIDSCKLSPCSCSPVFTHICCRHRFLQTQPMLLQPIIYVHLLQAAIPANSAHVPAAHYLRTSGAGIDSCKLSPCSCSP